MTQPEMAESDPETIKRSWRLLAPLSCSMAKGPQEPIDEWFEVGVEQRQQECVA